MFTSICRNLPRLRFYARTSSPNHKLFSSLKTTSNPNSSNRHSFTVSYLINSCGFDPEKAISTSKHMNFETPDKPDLVLAFFKNHGFSETQISIIVSRFPVILVCNLERNLGPKLEFFSSIGISRTDVAKMISSTPKLFKSSLKNQIIPSFNFYRALLQSHEKTIATLKRYPRLLSYNCQTHVAPSIEFLRELGVPESSSLLLLVSKPRVFGADVDRFKKVAEEVKKMGFNPLRKNFVSAIDVMWGMSKLTWEKKVDLYKKWGWSVDEILAAFVKHPRCMSASENKIMGVMNILINKMGCESSFVARRPLLITLSLEKRIVPRCSVYQVLFAKGLIKKDCSLIKFLECPEKQFPNMILKCYEEEAPELLELYSKKVDLSKWLV